jgi:hypothetical protein
MTNSQALVKMTEIASQMTVADLKEQAVKMFNCFEDYADDVLSSLLAALESKVSEEEFVSFCEAM